MNNFHHEMKIARVIGYTILLGMLLITGVKVLDSYANLGHIIINTNTGHIGFERSGDN